MTDRLKAPSTADFSGTNATAIDLDQGTYRVTGSVDSQNGFGAMIRSDFTCELDLNSTGASWSLTSLTGLT